LHKSLKNITRTQRNIFRNTGLKLRLGSPVRRNFQNRLCSQRKKSRELLPKSLKEEIHPWRDIKLRLDVGKNHYSIEDRAYLNY
jgi:hypothetical protein